MGSVTSWAKNLAPRPHTFRGNPHRRSRDDCPSTPAHPDNAVNPVRLEKPLGYDWGASAHGPGGDTAAILTPKLIDVAVTGFRHLLRLDIDREQGWRIMSSHVRRAILMPTAIDFAAIVPLP